LILHTVIMELDSLLSEGASLVELYKNKELSFFSRSLQWFEKLEGLSDKNRWPLKAEMAALRGRMITASRVQSEDQFAWMPKSKNRRRAKEALTAECIHTAVGRFMEFVSKDRELHGEAANILRQILSVAVAKGLIEMRPAHQADSAFIAKSWRAAAGDEELNKMCTHVVGLVGAYNAYMLFDKAFGEIFMNGGK